jgi:RNA-binding protein 26
LDNRTRKITVSAADLRGGKDEEFRHYLMNTGLEVEGIEPHPDKDDTQIVTFKDRRTAEKFIYTGNDIPNVGEVTLAWFNAPPPNPSPSKSEDPSRMDTEENGTSAASSSAIHHHHINSNDHGDDDVYEDDEGRWLPDE